jgi:hypothetical protein
MAKEFIEYSKKYKSQPATDKEVADAKDIEGWEFDVTYYSVIDIAHAVYGSSSSEEWQKFRVGLKGCSTKVKLLRLERRRVAMIRLGADEADLERIRINNYIGALVRGGQLEAKTLRVLR